MTNFSILYVFEDFLMHGTSNKMLSKSYKFHPRILHENIFPPNPDSCPSEKSKLNLVIKIRGPFGKFVACHHNFIMR